jgi:hypothetical protein
MFQDYKFEFKFAQGIRLGSKPLFHMNLEQPKTLQFFQQIVLEYIASDCDTCHNLNIVDS